jgi:hypothetical protein
LEAEVAVCILKLVRKHNFQQFRLLFPKVFEIGGGGVSEDAIFDLEAYLHFRIQFF